jgi:putative lipoic acid-binding regulatory protein
MSDDPPSDERPLDEHGRLLALLEAQHRFPGEYHLSVITYTEETVFVALREAIEGGLEEALSEEAYQRLPSRAGKYTSHRFRVRVRAATHVLELYERIRRVQGVVNVL